MCRHLAGETEQELRLEAELLHLATSGRGSAGQQQSLEDERLSEGRKISQSWLNAAERVTRKTSVVRISTMIYIGHCNQENVADFTS